MNVTEQIEEKLGLKIEQLSPDEKQTYFSMLKVVQDAQLTPEKLKDYITSMRDAVAKELVNEPEFIRILFFKFENRKQILLKARLQNYLLLEAFLSSPKKAQEQLEAMVEGIAKK